MKHIWPVWLVAVALLITGCPKRDDVPEYAYDPELLEAARAAREERERADREAEEAMRQQQEQEEKGECSRETGGCRAGYICYDSYFCKGGDKDQCSASGDKMCHKKCFDDNDCPSDTPYCREIAIFHGTERGILEKFCVKTRAK